jgi:hypothetical protein
MLRLLIGTGVLLMAVGFGAAGWQYWQSLPAAPSATTEGAPATPAPEPAKPAPVSEVWLASPSGGLIAQDMARAYLVQDRLAPARLVQVTRVAELADLLGQGEALPGDEFLQVLADIRAPRVAEDLCAVLLQGFAAECVVHSARVVPDSVDPAAGTARFKLELAYNLPKSDEAVPDLATRVLRTVPVSLTLDPGSPEAAAAETSLGAALAAVTEACAAETVGDLCRMLQLSLDWAPGQPVQAQAEIGWLDPLPDGVTVAPPLSSAQGG